MKTPTAQDVLDAASALGRPVTEEQAERLAIYLGQLVVWNRKMNLVGKADWGAVFNTLAVDSLHLADFLESCDLSDPVSLDLGAGAGLPGIPLRCLWDAGDYWLVEVREKRTLFMRSVLGRMGLARTQVHRGRAEESLAHLEKQGVRTPADLVLSRAFMPWRELLPFVRPLLTDGGTLVVLSNEQPPEADALPDGWLLARSMSYAAADFTRFFWALTPAA